MKYRVYEICGVPHEYLPYSTADAFIRASEDFDTELAAQDFIDAKERHHPTKEFTIIKIY